MSYLDFEQGMTGEQFRQQKIYQAARRREEDLQNRWREFNRILTILRNGDPVLMTKEQLDAWYRTVQDVTRIAKTDLPDEKFEPNRWFGSKFPYLDVTYGAPFLETETPRFDKRPLVKPVIINSDYFAIMLGGDPSLGHSVVYVPRDGFYFKDPEYGALRKTSDEKMQILLSNYFLQCARVCLWNVDIGPLYREFREPKLLQSIVKQAKVMLEVSPTYFNKADSPRRWEDGKYLGPQVASDPNAFVLDYLNKRAGAFVTLSDLFTLFDAFGREVGHMRLSRSEFKELMNTSIADKFGVRLRNDIRIEGGGTTQGWKNIELLPARVGVGSAN